MINLSVSIFGQITRYRIYTVSRGPIRLLEIQYPMSNIYNIYIYTLCGNKNDLLTIIYLLSPCVISVYLLGHCAAILIDENSILEFPHNRENSKITVNRSNSLPLEVQ